MVAHPIVALLLLPLNHSLALQPLGLRLEHARQQTPRPQRNEGEADDRTLEGIQENIVLAAEDVGGSLAEKFNDLSSIHFATPQFSYIPAYLSDAVNVKKPDFDQIVYQKKSTLENLLNPTKESIRDLILLKKKAIDNIVNPKKTTIEKYVKSRRKKLGDLIEFKKSAINNLVVPKKDKIEDLIDLKRSKLAEIGSHFPGSERLRHELFSGARRYQQKLLEPLRQAYQGLREGLADGAGQLYRPPEQASPPTTTSYINPITPSSFSPSHPEGQAILPSQKWNQAGDSFKPIFRESTSSYPKASKPSYEKPEKRETPVKSVRVKPSECPFAPQYCPTAPPPISSRLPKRASLMAAKEDTNEEAVVERVVKGRLRVAPNPTLRHSQIPQLRSPQAQKATKPVRHLGSAKLVRPPRPSGSPNPSRKEQRPKQGLSRLPDGFHGTLKIPRESTPINRAVHARKIFLNIDDFMENLRRRGLPTKSLSHPNTIPIHSVDDKQVQVLRGRLKTQEPSVLPRSKDLSAPILATETRANSASENVDNRRIDQGSEISEEGRTDKGAQDAKEKPELMTDHSFGRSTAIDVHTVSSSPPSFPSYGKKVPDTVEEDLDPEVANVDPKVFADDDLELVVGLVKPLVAQLKAGHTTGADDQTEVLQNSMEGTELPPVIPSNDLEETTTSAGLVISDYYGEEEVTPKSVTGFQVVDTYDSDEPVAVINQLPENIEVMNLVTDVSETEVKEPVNLPIYMAMTDKDTLDTRDDEVFLLPAGHGLQFSFKVGELGLLGEGGSLNVV